MKDPKTLMILLALMLLPIALTFLFSGGKSESHAHAVKSAEHPHAGQFVIVSTNETVQVKSELDDDYFAPIFAGFEDERYQEHDDKIVKFVLDFNRNKAHWAGANSEQTNRIDQLTVAQVKSQMIQESGGNDVRSRAAWTHDPLQANVPGDWSPYKKYLGLREPRKRNEGSFDKNLKAGIMLLVRKGFGVSGQPAANKPDGIFDGWETSLERYNGRSDLTPDGRIYREVYAERILDRAGNPGSNVSINIPFKKNSIPKNNK